MEKEAHEEAQEEEEEDEVQVQVDAAAVHHSMANERIQPSITVSA